MFFLFHITLREMGSPPGFTNQDLFYQLNTWKDKSWQIDIPTTDSLRVEFFYRRKNESGLIAKMNRRKSQPSGFQMRWGSGMIWEL